MNSLIAIEKAHALFENKSPTEIETGVSQSIKLIAQKPAATVQTLADAVALSTTENLSTGELVKTVEYIANTGAGGNAYKLMDSSPSARPSADGGSIIHIGSGNLYLSAINKTEFSLQQYGLVDDDFANTKIQSMITAGAQRIYSEKVINVRFNDKVDATGFLFIDFHNVKVTQTTPLSVFKYTGAMGALKTITNINKTTKTITVDESGLSVGDVVKIISEDKAEGSRPDVGGEFAREGQFVTIKTINSGNVVVNEAIEHDFLTSPRLSKMEDGEFKVRGGIYCNTVTEDFGTVFWADNPKKLSIESVSITFCPYIGIRVNGGYQPVIKDISFGSIFFDDTWKAHGVSFEACYCPVLENVTGVRARHIFATNQQRKATGDFDLSQCGSTVGLSVRNVTANGDFVTPFDTHHGVNGAHISDCSVVSASGRAVVVRGKSVTYTNTKIKNALSGFLVYSEDGITENDYTSDIKIINPIIIADEQAFDIRKSKNVNIHDAQVNLTALDSAITISDSTVNFYNLTLNISGGTSANDVLVRIKNSQVNFYGKTVINVTDHTGATNKIFQVSPDDTAGTSVYVQHATVIGNAAFPAGLMRNEATGNSPKFIIDSLSATTTGGLLMSSFSGEFSADTAITISGTGARDSSSLYESLSEGETLSIDKANNHLTIRVNPDITDRELAGIENGNFEGQRLTLINFNSGKTFVVPNGGNILNISNSDKIIAARDVTSYIWIDSKWHEVK